MRVGLLTHGSRGDVQPFVALALELLRRGARVELAGPPNGADLIRRAGIEPLSLPVDSQAFLDTPRLRRLLAEGHGLRFMSEVGRAVVEAWDEFADTTLALAARCDVLVVNGITWNHAIGLVDFDRTPFALQLTFPAVATRAHASPILGGSELPLGWMNRLSHTITDHLVFAPHRAPIARWRSSRGLPPLRGGGVAEARRLGMPILLAWDEALSRRPDDHVLDTVATGDWLLDAETSERFDGPVSRELDAWLALPRDVVYVGFGSMPVRDVGAVLDTLREVVRARGLRALVVAGWSELVPGLSDDELRVERSVPHGKVLPRCVAAVHHGGAGTTHAVARAGLPSVVCPLMIDQFFWARRVSALGVGAWCALSRLDRSRLAAALDVALRPETGERARALAATMRSDGTARAAERVLALATRAG